VRRPARLVVVSVGTDHHPFGRLVEWIDRWAADGAPPDVRCLVQRGTAPPPRHADTVDYLDYEELAAALAQAAAVVCHAGPATIVQARALGHVPVCVPRDPAAGEHVDGHQLRFASMLGEAGLVRVASTEQELRAALDLALGEGRRAVSGEGKGRPRPAAVDTVAAIVDELAGTSARRRHPSTAVAPATAQAWLAGVLASSVPPPRQRPSEPVSAEPVRAEGPPEADPLAPRH
jgi:UDP-N-acetylglucosamine transferase subunit ALG13